MIREKLLIVDDEADLLSGLTRLADGELTCDIETASSAGHALERMKDESFGVILSDIRMPGMNGIELLETVTNRYPGTDTILMTAYGTIDQAVEALQKGAVDFVTKPLHYNQLFHILRKTFERRRLIARNLELEHRLKLQTKDGVVGHSPAIRKVLSTIEMIADLPVTVLITGESGTGKELAARTIHRCSRRGSNRMICINCAALPESVLESELFGHRKGAFTGADRDYPGLFVAADRSTLFLDEIGEMALPLQAKLLRVLQEKEVRPIGDTVTKKIDTRVLASTNRNLEEMVATGKFREDLYFRLNEIPLPMPSLAEMTEDIPLLANHFLNIFCGEFGKSLKSISPEGVQLLCRAPWPGNIRQLQNVLKRAILLGKGNTILPEHLQLEETGVLCTDGSLTDLNHLNYKKAKHNVLAGFSNTYFSHLLKKTGGNVSQAAKLCGLERQSLQQLLKKYDISADSFRT